MVFNQGFDAANLAISQAVTSFQTHRIEPKLCLTRITLDMDMRRLGTVSGIEEKSKGPNPQNCGPDSILLAIAD
jgi:hypothetical protein